MVVGSIIFGSANAFPLSVFARACGEPISLICYVIYAYFIPPIVGLSGGSVGIMHSVVGELTDKTNASTAFPLYDIVAAVGFIIGYAGLKQWCRRTNSRLEVH